MFRRIAIVNRGEAAMRLIHAVRDLNAEQPADERIETVALYTEGERKAWEVLSANKEKLMAVAEALIEYETISGDEVMTVMRGEKIVRTVDDEETKGPAGPAVPAAGKSRPPRPEPGRGGLEPYPQT